MHVLDINMLKHVKNFNSSLFKQWLFYGNNIVKVRHIVKNVYFSCHIFLTQGNNKGLLTESEVCTGKYLPEVADKPKANTFPYRPSKTRLINRLLYMTPQPRSQGFRVRTRRGTRKPWSGPVT
jgi:hypothetical protein